MNKHIWIINEYAGNPQTGMEYRHYYIGKELVKLGYEVTVVSASYSHLFKNLPQQSSEVIDGVKFLWLKVFNYKNSHNKLRIIKWFLFTFKIFFLRFKLKKPDVIIVSPMAPFPILPAYFLAKSVKAKLIYEVKDIWPLSLIAIGGFKPSHPFIRFMAWFEKFALKKSDIIVSNLQNYGTHIKKDIGLDRNFHWISNGIDLDELNNIESLSVKIDEMFPKDKFIIGYTGTVGAANALSNFLEASNILASHEDILFVVVGDGQEKEHLVNVFGKNKNVLFVPSIPKPMVQSILNKFDACYIGLQKEELFKYGVSPNKLFDYMYSGKPILYAIDSGKNIIDVAGCGISVGAQNDQEIAKTVLKLSKMTGAQRDKLGVNGKEYVLKHFTYDNLAQKYTKLF